MNVQPTPKNKMSIALVRGRERMVKDTAAPYNQESISAFLILPLSAGVFYV